MWISSILVGKGGSGRGGKGGISGEGSSSGGATCRGRRGGRGTGAAAMSPVASCTASQLAEELGPDDAAMGHVGQVVSFKNISTTTCTLKGYPGLRMFDAAGQLIPTEVTDGPSYIVPALPDKVVVLTAGSEASFDVGYSDATGYGTAECPTSSQVAVTPPDASQPITVSWRIQPYGGSTIEKLQCGQIAVSPVYSGSGTAP